MGNEALRLLRGPPPAPAAWAGLLGKVARALPLCGWGCVACTFRCVSGTRAWLSSLGRLLCLGGACTAWAGLRGVGPSVAWAGLAPGRVLHPRALPWWVTFAERVRTTGDWLWCVSSWTVVS